MRNKEVHGIWYRRKWKRTTQQKEKAVMQDQAMCLYYCNKEEEIEKTKAVWLESFMAMKTRTINNSVVKWAEQLTGKVISIIE